MNSSFSRTIIYLLIGYVILLIILSMSDWIQTNYPRRPSQLTNQERIQHPVYHSSAIRALDKFYDLSDSEKTHIRHQLNQQLTGITNWLDWLNESRFQLICLGELHTESTRNFLSSTFFTTINMDILLLEAVPEEINHFMTLFDNKRDYFPLLDADILNIIRTSTKKNPHIKIFGIEQTNAQQNASQKRHSRDDHIFTNFWDRFESGKTHIALLGALHCADTPNWFYGNLCKEIPFSSKLTHINVIVLGEHQNGPLEAFVYFLDEIGLPKKNFAIHDYLSLPSFIDESFQQLSSQLFDKYRSVIVFRQ